MKEEGHMLITDYEKIVTNLQTPTLVLAGPGSGKTYMLSDRVKRLLDSGVDKNEMSVIAFGREAVKHMYHELTKKQGHFKIKPKHLPRISTMHSLGFRILLEKPKHFGLKKQNLKVVGDDRARALFFRDASLMLDYDEHSGKTASICKQRGECDKDPSQVECQICEKYWQIMEKCNYIDFDDQILFACSILESCDDILEQYQAGANHLLIDEYQDINAAQFRLIGLLTKESRSGLFAVGDDAQSIYGFRGSDPKFILEFEKHFRHAKLGSLRKSFRCPKPVMSDAFKVLKRHYPSWKGKPFSKYASTETKAPYIWQFASEIAEAKKVARIAANALPEKSLLILVPKKEFFPIIIQHLIAAGVPFEHPEGLLPERLKTASIFFRWVNDPSNNFLTRLVIEELINSGLAKVPGSKKTRKLRPETLRRRVAEETNLATLWESVDKHHSLYSVIQNYSGNNPIISKIQSGLDQFSSTFNNDKQTDVGKFAEAFFTITGLWQAPAKFAEDVASAVSALERPRVTGAAVAELKTMRKAKGLQADIVIMVGLEDDIIPGSARNIVEEARLFFVSMTRAREYLYLFHSSRRPRNISYGKEMLGKKRSRFLNTIGRASQFKR